MINILKLRKIEKEKKQQDKQDSREEKSFEEKSLEGAPEEQTIENIDEKIIEEIALDINNAPDSPGDELRSASEELLKVTHEIEEVDASVEIQQLMSPVEQDEIPDAADPWITELKAEEPKPETIEVKEPEIDPAEAFRQALIAEVLRDESMVTRAQVEEEEKMINAKPEAPRAVENKTVPENKTVQSSSQGAQKAETPKSQDLKAQQTAAQEVKAHEAKSHEAKSHEAIVQLVGFNLGKECYGVDIKRIKEINRMTEITRVPRAPGFIEGVINLRGSVIPVINLRKKVKMPTREYDKDTRIIIVELAGKTIGFIVDAVKEVLRFPESLLTPPPTLAVGKNADYITAVARVEDELVILLDPDKVLSREETQKLEESDGKKNK